MMGILISGGSILAPCSAMLLSEQAQPEFRGTILGLNQCFASSGRVLGPLMAAMTYQSCPVSIWYTAAACSLLGAGLLCSSRGAPDISSQIESRTRSSEIEPLRIVPLPASSACSASPTTGLDSPKSFASDSASADDCTTDLDSPRSAAASTATTGVETPRSMTVSFAALHQITHPSRAVCGDIAGTCLPVTPPHLACTKVVAWRPIPRFPFGGASRQFKEVAPLSTEACNAV